MSSESNRTLEKGLDMLFQFTEKKPVLSVKEIMELLDLSRSTVYRLLETLKNKELIQDCGSGQYSLGLNVFQLSKIAKTGMNLINMATPIMEELSQETGETAILSGLVNNQAICIDRIESSQTIKLAFERGRMHPLHAGASAKVLLAFMEIERQDRTLEELKRENLIDDINMFKESLKKVKDQGYVVSSDEMDLGAWAVAAPIFGANGDIIAGLSVAGPDFRINSNQKEKITNLLLAKVKRLNEKLKLAEINYI
ncbi:IclR family transcriptional regulator [Sporosarcina jiandibaonis]|uniref:IclR family transcriptional regulator n=1 Tax=Sporosarcina jiandibaonis TaxID=2715535 RepID=UPI0015538C08|nr:IclR family transcriptional regulator [Sporosarcina jiandibaonis]